MLFLVGLETKKKFRNSKIFSKSLEKISNARKFRKKNSTSKLIFLLRSKKIHFEVKKSTSKLKLF